MDAKHNTDISRRALLFGRKALRDEEGATAIEYGLLAALIGVAIIGATRTLGSRISLRFRCANHAITQGEANNGVCNLIRK